MPENKYIFLRDYLSPMDSTNLSQHARKLGVAFPIIRAGSRKKTICTLELIEKLKKYRKHNLKIKYADTVLEAHIKTLYNALKDSENQSA